VSPRIIGASWTLAGDELPASVRLTLSDGSEVDYVRRSLADARALQAAQDARRLAEERSSNP
jgi:hypothetical protein